MENIIDKEDVMERVDGDMELLMDMVELFVEDCPRLLSKIRNAINQQDSEALEYSAHTLKGSVSNFSAMGAFEAAFKLEQMGREGNITNAAEAYTVLEREMKRLKPALTALGTENA